MATYWLTFRIAEDPDYAKRYERFVNAIEKITLKWWVEPTSFLLFESEHNIAQVAEAAKAAFNPRTDMALIGMPDFKSARLIGASTDHDIFDLMPFTKKV
jgi:hypothetical protein